jgi:heptosyltransferase-2
VVGALSGVDEVLTVPDRWLLAGNPLRKALGLAAAWWKLAGRSFDLIATGHSDWRYRLLSLTARGRLRRSFSQNPPRPGLYHGQEYARLVLGPKSVGFKASVKPPRLELAPKLRTKLPRNTGWTILLFPGGARNLMRDDSLRRWPLEHYAQLARRLGALGYTVVLGGSPSDKWILPSFEGLKVVNLVGATGLLQAAALCRACGLVITHDSGPLHLGLWAGAKVLSLFGPTDPGEKVVPSSRARVLWGGRGRKCRPCYDGRDYAACLDPVCLRGIKVEQVVKAARAMLR